MIGPRCGTRTWARGGPRPWLGARGAGPAWAPPALARGGPGDGGYDLGACGKVRARRQDEHRVVLGPVRLAGHRLAVRGDGERRGCGGLIHLRGEANGDDLAGIDPA